MDILLLSANGQVGFELARSLAPLGRLSCTTRGGRAGAWSPCGALDLSDPSGVERAVVESRPQVLVNAGAYTAVDRAEDEPELAHRVNAESVAAMARACARVGALFVHYSTDYVFDGRGSRPWREEDPTAPLGVYGESKRAGELAILASGCEHLVLRTAWVYAARGANFLRTMLRVGAQREELSVVDDQRGAPTPARWIAAATAALLVGVRARGGPVRELLHLSAGGECSWHDFAQAIFERAPELGLLPRAPRLRAISSAEYPTRARRPSYSRLDNGRLLERHGLALPDWRMGFDQVLEELAEARSVAGSL